MNINNYKFISLEPSTDNRYRFMALFRNIKTNKIKIIKFAGINTINYTDLYHINRDEAKHIQDKFIRRYLMTDYSNPLKSHFWNVNYCYSKCSYEIAYRCITYQLKKLNLIL